MSSAPTGFKEHYQDIEFYEAHYQELLTQYPDQWIAILDQQVVGASEDAFDLLGQLKARGVPTHRILTRHMTEEPELLILTNL